MLHDFLDLRYIEILYPLNVHPLAEEVQALNVLTVCHGEVPGGHPAVFPPPLDQVGHGCREGEKLRVVLKCYTHSPT